MWRLSHSNVGFSAFVGHLFTSKPALACAESADQKSLHLDLDAPLQSLYPQPNLVVPANNRTLYVKLQAHEFAVAQTVLTDRLEQSDKLTPQTIALLKATARRPVRAPDRAQELLPPARIAVARLSMYRLCATVLSIFHRIRVL
jgi:hypothetical protein